MTDDTMFSDVLAMLVILAVLVEGLETTTPGIKKVLAKTIEDAVKDLPDQDDPHGVKETLQTFHEVVTRDEPFEILFH